MEKQDSGCLANQGLIRNCGFADVAMEKEDSGCLSNQGVIPNCGSEILLEAAVVFLAVGRVVFFMLQSSRNFRWEGKALLIVSAISLFVELWISRDKLRLLGPRPSSSFGIVLGAVTIPLVLGARSVQISRLVSSPEFTFEAVADLIDVRQQIWISVLCSLRMLLYLGSFAVTSERKKVFSDQLFLIGFMISCMSKFVLGNAVQWGFLHAIGCKLVLEYFLRIFPGTTTVGEAMLVAEGFTLFVGKATAHTIGKIYRYNELANYATSGKDSRNDISAILQGIIIGPLIVPAICKLLPQALVYGSSCLRSPASTHKAYKTETFWPIVVFYSTLALAVFAWIPEWLLYVHGIHLYPTIWDLTINQGPQRLAFCVYWLAVISLPSFVLLRFSKNGRVPRILLRKCFHVMAVIMFIPAILHHQDFLELAFGVALGGFLIFEMIRVWKIPPLWVYIHRFMSSFMDKRDSDVLVISHFSLLLGCALPVWLTPRFTDRPLAPFAGLLSIGIGDTVASLIGYNFGLARVSAGSRKTVEGTLCGIASMVLACLLLSPFLATSTLSFSQVWFSEILAVVAAGLAEAYITQLDNAFVPLLFYALLSL